MKDIVHNEAGLQTEETVLLNKNDVLVTTTDSRGVIEYANPAFVRISGFEHDKLIKAPHRIVRHPDMPKAIFHTIWEQLKQRQTVCCYVKNKTADEKAYWVFAIMVPNDEGYISVRVAPLSATRETAETLYHKLLEREQDGLAVEKSAASLDDVWREVGFESFAQYSQQILNEEFSERLQAQSGRTTQAQLMQDIETLVLECRQLVDSISRGFKQVKGEPVNMRILSGRLEGGGAALGTISQNYDKMSGEMLDLIYKLGSERTGTLDRMKSALQRARAAVQVAELMKEASVMNEGQNSAEQGHALLADRAEELWKSGKAALLEIEGNGKTIADICRQIRRRINGLNVVKLLCRVESGRLAQSDSGLNGIIERLELFHDSTDDRLAELGAKANQIVSKSRALNR